MIATLWYSRSVHRVIFTTSTIPGHFHSITLGLGPKNGDLSFPLHSVVVDVQHVSQFNGICPALPRTNQYDYTMVVRKTELFFLTMNEMKVDMK